MSNSYLDNLPIEILHDIISNLETETILFSLRYVCKRLHSIVNAYNYYDFNFESTSKTKFLHICSIVPFEQVVSLTLSDKDKTRGQIKLFNKLFDINKFVRLRSLTLLHIHTNDLKVFLDFVNRSSLISLSIDSQIINIRTNKTLDLLSSTIEKCNLQKLGLNMLLQDMKEFQWPSHCTLTYLRLQNSITLNQFCIILQYSPCLQTVILKDFNAGENASLQMNYRPFLQLKSLTCQDGRIQINKLEQCFTLTPALVYLKLIGCGNLFSSTFDGHQWEQLIKNKLPVLKKFDFFISVVTHVNFDKSTVNEIISGFQTSFWLQENRCSIICDYIDCLHKLILYSLPVCMKHFEYCASMNKVSNLDLPLNNQDSSMMDNVRQLNLDLTEIMKNDEIQQISHLQFRNVTELTISINNEWPESSLAFLSTLIDLTRVVKLVLLTNFLHQYSPNIIRSINKLLEYTCNISMLSVLDYWTMENCTKTIKTIYSMLTPNIKHLNIQVNNRDEVQFIIENFKHLKSITFEYAQTWVFVNENYIQCLSDIKRHISTWDSQLALHVWLDKN